jgi:hypothetical protein
MARTSSYGDGTSDAWTKLEGEMTAPSTVTALYPSTFGPQPDDTDF